MEISTQDIAIQKENSEAQLLEVRQSLELEKTRHNQEETLLKQSIKELQMKHEDLMERHKKEIDSLSKAQEKLKMEAERRQTAASNELLARDRRITVLNDELVKMKEEEEAYLIISRSMDQLKSTCFEKIEKIKNSNTCNITTVLLQVQEIDNELEKKGCESTELNVLVSQVAFELTKLYEKQFQDLKSKALVLQKDLKTIGERYDKSKSEVKQLKLQIEQDTQKSKQMLEDEILKHESYQKDKLQAQKALSDKVLRDQEIQLEQKDNTIKDLLMRQTQLQKELERYKSLLAEAESLLQEVNKRHQVTQRELDNRTDEYER